MADRPGDKTKQTEKCEGNAHACPNLKEAGGGFEGEIYNCEHCGMYYRLYYEDMQ